MEAALKLSQSRLENQNFNESDLGMSRQGDQHLANPAMILSH